MTKTLKTLLYFFSLYHLVLGLMGILLTSLTQLVERTIAIAFNFSITMDDQTIWMIKVVAVYMLIMGIISFFAAKDPIKYKPIVYAISGLIGIRVIQRVLFAFEGDNFIINADPTRNIIALIFLAIYGLAILISALKIKEEAK
jgi:hypothetical protein